MARGTAEPKLTAADAMIDKLTIAIFLLQIVVVLVLGYFGNIWKDTQGLKVLFFYKQYLAQQIHFNFHACYHLCCAFSWAVTIISCDTDDYIYKELISTYVIFIL